MANINAHLPSSIAVAFHPPTENLLHDNLVRPVIPKPEIISSYTKFHEDHEHTQQDEYQESSSDKKRSQFFMARKESLTPESDGQDITLEGKKDFKEVISVIQARYNDSVHPFPNPTISFAI
ncbi:hypothetical protein ACR30L_02175 [Psychromonas sp. PT13]|uniref:hypothetical protein n=1 Tax=Psychromonas sp. PT13 TaxID=3439547 RepID=UPI003EBDA451